MGLKVPLGDGRDFRVKGYRHRHDRQGTWGSPYVCSPTGVPISLRTTEYEIERRGAVASIDAEFGFNKLTVAAHRLRFRIELIHLRPNEFRLPTHFFEHPDRLFTRHRLIAMLGKDRGEIDKRKVDAWVGRLHRSLEANGVPDRLWTVRSMGYVLESVYEAEDAHAA